MTAALKPGRLGDETSTTKPTAFAGSMAEAIEDALYELMPAERQFDRDVNTPEARDRRMLFVAIAQGVCKHLVANEAAIGIAHATGNDLAATHTVTIGSTP